MNEHLNERVNDRIAALLARCSTLRLARDIDRPVRFDAAGQAHAAQVAAREALEGVAGQLPRKGVGTAFGRRIEGTTCMRNRFRPPSY